MTKFKKFLAIIALTVFSLTFLVGCGLFVLNEERYRDQVALTVGEEIVTLGEVIDYLDTNGAAYLASGYTTQQIWDMLFPQFIQQKVMLNEYKTTHTASNNSQLAKQIGGNAAYLDDATLVYIQKAVYVSFYESLDSLTIKELKEDFTFADEKTSKDYPDMIDRTGNGQWTPEDEDSLLDASSLDKTLAKNYLAQDFKTINYVFGESDVIVIEKVDDINGRLKKQNDDDEDVRVKDYINAQNAAVSTMTKNIKNSKNMTLQEYVDDAVRKQVDLQIVNEYLATLYKANQTKITSQMFQTRLDNLVAQAEAKYAQDPQAFESFVTNLSDEDFVLYIPEQYRGEYYYVRSALVPFSDEQTQLLAQAKKRYGENSDTYIAFRNSLAFGEEFEIENNLGEQVDLIDVRNELLAVNSLEEFLTFTYKYNTDPGMQNPVHPYVVSKKPTDLDYAGTNFVKDFVGEARRMINSGVQVSYVVTDYGIHALYIVGEVVEDNIDFNQRNQYGIEGGLASWRFHEDMYIELKEIFADDTVTALYNEYKEDGKIEINTDVIKTYTESIAVTYKE